MIQFYSLVKKGFVLATIVICILVACSERKVDFNTEVRPILNKSCISCHGGVKQSGGFGLVFRENALRETKNGKLAIVPGDPDRSELIARINHSNPDMRMPLEKDPLSQEEIETLTKWIEQGAQWDNHWAYLNPEESEVPDLDAEWANNEIDQFVLRKIEEKGLIPSPQADQYDLVRRLYLDMIGLPPSAEQVDQFVNSDNPNRYEATVDQLLASPAFGEHWASMWLDLARYADSKGYEKDAERIIWKYRDWVIEAFNNDMPFDQFTIEQLAGDLLPDPTIDQLIATAFHRNTLSNTEGGTDNEEYRLAAVMDRVSTTWEVWQSTTMACVQCHSHPYDPIKHEEFYESLAFFNTSVDWDDNSDNPRLKDLNEVDQADLDEVKKYITNVASEHEAKKWERRILTGEPKLRPEDFQDAKKVAHFNRGDEDYMKVYDGGLIQINNLSLKNIDRIYLSYRQRQKAEGILSVRARAVDGPLIGQSRLKKTEGFKDLPIKITTAVDSTDLFFQFESTNDDYSCLIDGFLLSEKLPTNSSEKAEDLYVKIDQLLNADPATTTPIMMDKPESHSRVSNVFVRGNWMVKGEEVSPDVPDLLNAQDRSFTNRLDLAQWLVSDENALTARVMVNRFWAQIFGMGIVQTVEDFGTLGESPSHPELLDWLAIRFSRDWGWSMKTLIKEMVMSATYQQSAIIEENAQEIDPSNKWLARSSRVRLSAEQVRDQALAVSGLLSDKMYGESVMPYQPEGVWSVIYSSKKWRTSEGEDAYRRALYTYLRRSSPYPSFITFDGSAREFCLSRRINTNTPLQALVTLNDPVYMEAAKNLAREVAETKQSKMDQVKWAYQKVMGKPIGTDKAEILFRMYDESLQYYQAHQEEAKDLSGSEKIEDASLIVVSNVLLNLDEFLVKN